MQIYHFRPFSTSSAFTARGTTFRTIRAMRWKMDKSIGDNLIIYLPTPRHSATHAARKCIYADRAKIFPCQAEFPSSSSSLPSAAVDSIMMAHHKYLLSHPRCSISRSTGHDREEVQMPINCIASQSDTVCLESGKLMCGGGLYCNAHLQLIIDLALTLI